MLQVDYNEEYVRFDRDITQTGLQYIQNSIGHLVLVPDIFTNNKLSLTSDYFLGNNQTPQFTSLVVDNITFFSTNPNCGSYFPLRLRINNKPILPVGDVDVTQLDDYFVITDDLFNLTNPNVQSAEYVKQIDYAIQRDQDTSIQRVVELNGVVISSDGTDDYYRFDSTTDPTTTIVVPTADNWGVLDLKANEKIAVLLTFENDDLRFVDATNNNTIEEENDVAIIKYQLIDNYLITYTYDILNDDIGTINIWIKTGNNWILENRYIESFVPKPLPVSNTIKDVNFSFFGDQYYINNLGEVGTISFSKSNLSLFTISFPTPTGIPPLGVNDKAFLYYGGDFFNDPTIYVFTVVGQIVKLYRLDAITFKATKIYENTFGVNDILEIKRFRNQAYFFGNGVLNIFNLGTGIATTYDVIKNNRLKDYYLTVVHLNSISLVANGQPSLAGQPYSSVLHGNYFKSNRVTPSTVYEISFNYNSSEYPWDYSAYQINLGVELNRDKQGKFVSIKDLEIFKIVLDCRFRYSFQKLSINPAIEAKDQLAIPTNDLLMCLEDCEDGRVECNDEEKNDEQLIQPCKDGECNISEQSNKTNCTKKTCKTRCNRSVGGVNRILGYVGEDFSVSDFLNIYSTR